MRAIDSLFMEKAFHGELHHAASAHPDIWTAAPKEAAQVLVHLAPCNNTPTRAARPVQRARERSPPPRKCLSRPPVCSPPARCCWRRLGALLAWPRSVHADSRGSGLAAHWTGGLHGCNGIARAGGRATNAGGTGVASCAAAAGGRWGGGGESQLCRVPPVE